MGPHQERVTFVISGLVVGGAERILTAIANGWVAAGRPVTIVTLDHADAEPFFPVDPRIRLQRLGVTGVSRGPLDAVRNNLRRMWRIREAIGASHPDVVIAFMDRTNVLTLFASIGRPWPVIVAERTARDPNTGSAWRFLRRLAYRRARTIVVQTEGSRLALPSALHARTVTIPNPVLDVPPPDEMPVVVDPWLVTAIGRLVPQKGYDLLIAAFGRVVDRVPEARLEIWGAGPEGPRMAAAITDASLDRSVALRGETADPASVIRRSALVVLSSRVEGFPNVILEAMALGRAVVAFDCEFGPREIIRDGVDGRLVPAGDTDALADAIVALLVDADERAALARRGPEVFERFSMRAILATWDGVVTRARGTGRA